MRRSESTGMGLLMMALLTIMAIAILLLVLNTFTGGGNLLDLLAAGTALLVS